MKPPRYGHMLADGLTGADAEGRRFTAYGGPLRGLSGAGGDTPGGHGGDGTPTLAGGGSGSSNGVAAAAAYGGSGGSVGGAARGTFSYGGAGGLLAAGDDEDQSLASLSYRYTTRKTASNRYPANTAVARFSRRARMEATLRRARARAAAQAKSFLGAARSAHIAASRYSYLAVFVLLAIPFCGGLFLVLAATSGRRAGAAARHAGAGVLDDVPGLPPEIRKLHELATAGAPGANGSTGAGAGGGGVREVAAAAAAAAAPEVPLAVVTAEALRAARFKAVYHTRAPAVSLLLACKNRLAAVEMGASSWAALPGVDEIVLVDWGQTMAALPGFPALAEMSETGKLLYVSAGNATTPWSLPRAYNLAASLAAGKFLLKLDCDTRVDAGFLKAHPMHLDSPVFYTSESDTLSGVLLVARSKFLHVGGYDERLEGFGGEAVDLRARLIKEHGEQVLLNEDLVTHSRSEELLYQDDAVVVPGLSRRRHALGLKLIGHPWSRSLARQMGGRYTFGYSAERALARATITAEARELFSLLGEHKAAQATATALSETLHDDYRVPWDVIPQLSVEDQSYLVSRFHATKQDARALFAIVNGRAAGERLHSLISAMQLGLHHKLPVIVVWAGQEPADEGVSDKTLVTLPDLFDLNATNAKLAEAGGRLSGATTGGGDGIAAVRLISLREWKCRQANVHRCAALDDGSGGDPVYESVAQVPVPTGRQVWDETNPVPLRPGAHTLLRLAGHVRIGNEVSRAAAYGALVTNAAVAAALTDRGDGEDKVAVFATANKAAWERFAGPVFAGDGAGPPLNDKQEVRLVVTGPAWVPMKEFMYGAGAVKGMEQTVRARRNVPKAIAELADALAAAKCKKVWPELALLADTYKDPAAMALIDTQPLAQNY